MLSHRHSKADDAASAAGVDDWLGYQGHSSSWTYGRLLYMPTCGRPQGHGIASFVMKGMMLVQLERQLSGIQPR